MTVRSMLEDKLRTAFAPEWLEIVDESHRHAGHAGHRPEGETHFRVAIVSAAFAGKSRVAQHQMVYAALKGRMGGLLHALALDTGPKS